MVGRWRWWAGVDGVPVEMVGRCRWWAGGDGGPVLMVGQWRWWAGGDGGPVEMVGRWRWCGRRGTGGSVESAKPVKTRRWASSGAGVVGEVVYMQRL
jgi:hypothetical protein